MSARFRSFPITLLALLSMLLAGFAGPGDALGQRNGPLPDIAAMPLFMQDVNGADLGGEYVPFGGRCYDLMEVAMTIADVRGLNVEDVVDEMSSHELLRRCDRMYALPSEAGADGPPLVIVRSYVYLYASDEGAETGFTYLEDESSDITSEDLAEGAGIGDESEATLTTGTDGRGDFQSLDLAYREGNLTGGVTIRDYTGEMPEVATAEDLVDLLRDRVDDALDGDAPGLGAMVMSWEGPGLQPGTESGYTIIDGQGEKRLVETRDEFEQRINNYGGADAVYQDIRVLPVDVDGTPTDFQFGVILAQFDSEDSATEFFTHTPERYEENPNITETEFIEDAPAYGDESWRIRDSRTGGDGSSYIYDRVIARVDNILVNVAVRGTEVPVGIVELVIEDQVACVEDGACSGTMTAPLTFSSDAVADAGADKDEDRPRSQSSRDDDEEDETSSRRESAGGETFLSELYPYSMDYTDDWTMEEPQVIGDMELLSMSNGTSGVVIIVDSSHEGDVEACLDNAVAYIADDPEMEDVELMEDEDGEPIEVYDDDAAYAAYSYVTPEGGEMALYAECRTIVPGEVTMEFNQFVALDEFEDEIEARETLLDGITVED